MKQDWGNKGFKDIPIKRSKGTFAVPPNSSPGGQVKGSPAASKGVNHKKAIHHDGIVMGGSITRAKASVSGKSINKLSNPHGPNVLGK